MRPVPGRRLRHRCIPGRCYRAARIVRATRGDGPSIPSGATSPSAHPSLWFCLPARHSVNDAAPGGLHPRHPLHGHGPQECVTLVTSVARQIELGSLQVVLDYRGSRHLRTGTLATCTSAHRICHDMTPRNMECWPQSFLINQVMSLNRKRRVCDSVYRPNSDFYMSTKPIAMLSREFEEPSLC